MTTGGPLGKLPQPPRRPLSYSRQSSSSSTRPEDDDDDDDGRSWRPSIGDGVKSVEVEGKGISRSNKGKGKEAPRVSDEGLQPLQKPSNSLQPPSDSPAAQYTNENQKVTAKSKRKRIPQDDGEVVRGIFLWPSKISKTSRVIKNTSSACRDHLAVERNYLSWLRLSSALSTISGALLIRFHFSVRPLPPLESSFSKPLGIIFFILGLIVLASGTATFYRTQSAYIHWIGFVEVGRIGRMVIITVALAVGITTLLLIAAESQIPL